MHTIARYFFLYLLSLCVITQSAITKKKGVSSPIQQGAPSHHTSSLMVSPLVHDIPMQTHMLSFCMHKNYGTKIYGYYKGQRIIFDKGTCLFDEHDAIKTFFIAITPEIDFITSTSGIIHLQRKTDVDCRLFCLSKKYNTKKRSTFWSITEEQAAAIPRRLPDTTFIIFLNPSLIESVQDYQFKKNKNPDIAQKLSGAPITYLPYIHLKKSVTHTDLHTAEIITMLHAIDHKQYIH